VNAPQFEPKFRVDTLIQGGEKIVTRDGN